MTESNRTSNPRLAPRYKVIKDRKDEYCLKQCDDGDLTEWSEYDAERRRGDILNAELSGFMAAAVKREAQQKAEIERLIAELASLKDAFNDRVRIIEIQLKDKDRLRAALKHIQRDGHWLSVVSIHKIATCALEGIPMEKFYERPADETTPEPSTVDPEYEKKGHP